MTGIMRPYVKRLVEARTVDPYEIPWRLTMQLCLSYGWPRALVGGGRIGIIALGGGRLNSDVTAQFAEEGLPPPSFSDISFDGTKNNMDPSDPASAEATLDAVAAAVSFSVATGQPAAISVYWADNSNPDSIANVMLQAARDGCDVFSCSWGADEALWGTNHAQYLESAAIQATNMGMVVIAAAGDNDSSDGGGSPANVDLPASAPHVIGCGGTNRPHYYPERVEKVWNNNPGNASGEGTGGGYSTIFGPQSWQVGVPAGGGRMVPDIAACADPYTGVHIILGGQDIVVGGTSLVAPLYAGLIAACGQKLGFITPTLWGMPQAFDSNIPGDNGMYSQPPYPGPCTGLGTLRASMLPLLLKK